MTRVPDVPGMGTASNDRLRDRTVKPAGREERADEDLDGRARPDNRRGSPTLTFDPKNLGKKDGLAGKRSGIAAQGKLSSRVSNPFWGGVRKTSGNQSVSRVLSGISSGPVIYLGVISQPPSIDLPIPTLLSKIRTSHPGFGTYLVFQPIRFTWRLMSPSGRWALTPPFHPYPEKTRRYLFCGTFCSPDLFRTDSFPLGSMALYAARTFLMAKATRQGD
jgi:hypothetical protein